MHNTQIDWLRLRPFNGSQDAAFEEVCKQLFGAECRTAGGRWVPTGRIDAGVEGYGVMPDGGEWGVQAKWFLTSPTPQQWKQVDESVTTALDKHPRLTRYVVRMPVDLSDARTDGTMSARQRWDARRALYEEWAAERGMTLAFEFRGSHELAQELMAPDKAGLRTYWFGGPEFSPESVKRRIEDVLSAVGPRYSRELNVDVPLSRFIEAMTLSRAFVERVFQHYRAVRKSSSSLRADIVRERWAAQAEEIASACEQLSAHLEPLANDDDAATDWDAVSQIAREASVACRGLSRAVREAGEVEDDAAQLPSRHERNRFEHQVYGLWKLASALENLREYADGGEAHLSRAPFLLLVGEAGSGKTHFLCDVALRAVSAGNIAILALGSPDFDTGGLWHEIGRRNGLPSYHVELLGALQSAAEAAGTRALVLVDAINEGPSAAYWHRELSAIINQIRRYPLVGLAVSVRDAFLDACVREDAKAQMIEVVHEGFAYDIIEAQRAFFRNFKIREPAVPLLLPEFANPLFLMLFCKGIVAAGLSEVPRGLSGLTDIFQFFVDAQNRKISTDLDVDPDDRLVHRALAGLAAALTSQRPNSLDRAAAKATVETVHTAPQFSRSLFGALEREGLISTVRFGDAPYVRFTYERMADHARARRLLEQIGDQSDVAPDLLGARLAEAVMAEGDALRSAGLFEALSLQVPEQYGHELLALLPPPHYYWQYEAFLRSVPWRRPDSVGEETARVVFGLFESDAELRAATVDCLLGCALVAGNRLNANGLHRYLRGLEMSRRDSLWTVTISRRQYDASAVMRLTSWARGGAFGLRADAPNDAAKAAAITLLWLCGATNRRVRDEATKGIVTILDAVPAIATTLYGHFHDCNDPYIVQRLYAALAGHAMRTRSATEDLGELARAVVRIVQQVGLPVDILSRDYARTIVERAEFLGAIGSEVDVESVRPPYGAAPPDVSDADDALYARYSWNDSRESPDSEGVPRGLLHVHSSLGPYGDFARYIVGTNYHGHWLATPLTDAAPLTREGRRAAFIASLSPAQKRLYNRFTAAQRSFSVGALAMLRRALEPPDDDGEAHDGSTVHGTDKASAVSAIEELYRSIGTAPDEGSAPLKPVASEDLDDADKSAELEMSPAKRHFVASLEATQARTFEALETAPHDFERYDLARGTRWMFRRVLEMGYGGPEVDAFDDRASQDAWSHGEGRQPAMIERIGKKYQWMAYFEFSARMADNYYLENWRTDGAPMRYQVPAQVVARDIDPSLLVVETQRPSFEPHPQSWWAGPAYTDWQEHIPIGDWMRDARNLPDPASTLAVTDGTGVQWICLNTHLTWREREVLLEERFDVPRRELWYLLFGYLVPKSEAQRAFRWLRRQDFYGRWLRPEAEDTYRLLWGELFWSPAFSVDSSWLTIPSHALDNAAFSSTQKLLIPASGAYAYERGNDNSVLDTLRVGFPIADIVYGAGGRASDPERGAWIDASGNVIGLDPSVAEPGPGAVLVRRDRLEAFLRNSPFALVWTLLSEKQVVGGAHDTYYGRLVTSGAYWFREAADGTFATEGGKTSRFKS